MPGQWGCDLHEEITAQQLEEVVKLDPRDFGDPSPEYGQLPQNTNAAARAILREDPPGTTPTIAAAALGTTIGVNTAFTPSFWTSRKASTSGIQIATTKTTAINPAFMATMPYTEIVKALVPGASGSGGGGGGGSGGGGGNGGSGGGGFPQPAPAAPSTGGNVNRGLKGNPPAIFDGNCSQSNKFLREFRIFRLSNNNNASMSIPLDCIGIATSYICGKNMDDWVEYIMNKVDMALAQCYDTAHGLQLCLFSLFHVSPFPPHVACRPCA